MQTYSRFAITTFFLLSLSAGACAQSTSSPLTATLSAKEVDTVRTAIKPTADDLAQAIVNNPAHAVDYGGILQDYLSARLMQPVRRLFSTSAETARTDKQIGSGFASSGSTSTVDKPGITDLLGIAIEHGAITQNITGNTLTLTTSPYALIAWIQGDTAETYQQYGNTYGRLGLSASFNLTDSTNPLASATRKQLSQWSANLRLFGDHSGRSGAAMDAFDKYLRPHLQALANTRAQIVAAAADNGDFFNTVSTEAAAQIAAFLSANSSATTDAKKQAVSKILLDVFFAHISELHMPPQDAIAPAIQAFNQEANNYAINSGNFEKALQDILNRPTLTLVYNQQQPSTGSNYSVLKLLYEQQPAKSLQITANINGSVYHHPDRTKNQQTFRGASAALELMNKLGRSPFVHDNADKSVITFSFSGRYERLEENRRVPGKKADIAVAGFKLEIPVAAGISFPISATYANATELIKEAHVQGNFGFTFDLDKLSALIHK